MARCRYPRWVRSTGSSRRLFAGFPCCLVIWVAGAWMDELAFSLSLVTYDKRFSGEPV